MTDPYQLTSVQYLQNKLSYIAETEFEKYRIIQDKLFQSDFDHWGTNNLLDFDKEE